MMMMIVMVMINMHMQQENKAWYKTFINGEDDDSDDDDHHNDHHDDDTPGKLGLIYDYNGGYDFEPSAIKHSFNSSSSSFPSSQIL